MLQAHRHLLPPPPLRLRRYYAHQKRRAGTFFKWLRLTQDQAGNRESTGTFVVGTGGRCRWLGRPWESMEGLLVTL